LPPACLTI